MKLKDPYETRIEVKSKIGSRMESLVLLVHKWEVIEMIDNSYIVIIFNRTIKAFINDEIFQ